MLRRLHLGQRHSMVADDALTVHRTRPQEHLTSIGNTSRKTKRRSLPCGRSLRCRSGKFRHTGCHRLSCAVHLAASSAGNSLPRQSLQANRTHASGSRNAVNTHSVHSFPSCFWSNLSTSFLSTCKTRPSRTMMRTSPHRKPLSLAAIWSINCVESMSQHLPDCGKQGRARLSHRGPPWEMQNSRCESSDARH